MGLEVDCYAGHRDEESPRRLRLDGRVVELTVIEGWRTPEGRWFRVRGDDGELYVLKHDERSGEWGWG